MTHDELIEQVARAVEAADSTNREVIALAAIAAKPAPRSWGKSWNG